jgi:hypothetical protein
MGFIDTFSFRVRWCYIDTFPFRVLWGYYFFIQLSFVTSRHCSASSVDDRLRGLRCYETGADR